MSLGKTLLWHNSLKEASQRRGSKKDTASLHSADGIYAAFVRFFPIELENKRLSSVEWVFSETGLRDGGHL